MDSGGLAHIQHSCCCRARLVDCPAYNILPTTASGEMIDAKICTHSLAGLCKDNWWGSLWELEVSDEDLMLISTLEGSKSRVRMSCHNLCSRNSDDIKKISQHSWVGLY
jgi:hypothetical protein